MREGRREHIPGRAVHGLPSVLRLKQGGRVLRAGAGAHLTTPQRNMAGGEDDVTLDGRQKKRRSTFRNAFPRLRLFTGRNDPAGREEQFEKFYIFLLDSNPFQPSIRAFEVNDPETAVDLDEALTEMLALVGERNFDLYDGTDGRIAKI